MSPAAHVTIQDNYFYGTSGHSQNYGVESYFAGDSLIVNNIFQHVVAPLMVHTNSGSVYAYNYLLNNTYDDGRVPLYHWMSAGFGMHSGGVIYNLFDGNIAPGIAGDYIHGNQVMNTVFRNYFLGCRRKCSRHSGIYGPLQRQQSGGLFAWRRLRQSSR
jgi:hypothetical protein